MRPGKIGRSSERFAYGLQALPCPSSLKLFNFKALGNRGCRISRISLYL